MHLSESDWGEWYMEVPFVISIQVHTILMQSSFHTIQNNGTGVEQMWNSRGTVVEQSCVKPGFSSRNFRGVPRWSWVGQAWNSRGTVAEQSRNAHENAMYRDLIIILLIGGTLEQCPPRPSKCVEF